MADYYMSPGGEGAKNGSDWANAFGMSEFETFYPTMAAGDTLYIYSGTYTTANAITTSLAGNNASGRTLIGVKDKDTLEKADLATMPIIECLTFKMGTYSVIMNIAFILNSTNASCFTTNNFCVLYNCYIEAPYLIYNSLTSMIVQDGVNSGLCINCKFKTSGNAIRYSFYIKMISCYVEKIGEVNEAIGIRTGFNVSLSNSIIINFKYGIQNSGSSNVIKNNIVDCRNIAASRCYDNNTNGSQSFIVLNNIFTNAHIGSAWGYTYEKVYMVESNNYYNCTTNRFNFPTSDTDTNVNPDFYDSSNNDYRVQNKIIQINSYPLYLSETSTKLEIDRGAMQNKYINESESVWFS